ncbi:MAG: hypothetical protein CMM76_02695 [Rhodospirillaceae bacterium]|nr:hypothetical protein [Rhodospirillaceae bacterium]
MKTELFKAQQSDALRDVFSYLAESCELDSSGYGEPRRKYGPRTLRFLSAAIVCRSYDKILYRLCHLTRAVMLADRQGQYDKFFFGDRSPGRVDGAAGFFLDYQSDTNRKSGLLRANPDGIVIDYDASAKSAFEISYKQIPLLAAMLEFLVSTVDYGEIHEIFTGLDEDKVTQKEISERSKRLSKALYAYLAKHLTPAQKQTKFQNIYRYLEGNLGSSFEEGMIDDQCIIDFWLKESVAGSTNMSDFKQFRTVFLAFLRFVDLMRDAEDLSCFENTLPFGTDRDAGEWEPAMEDESYMATKVADTQEDPLDLLAIEPANAIKFLNDTEAKLIKLPIEEKFAGRFIHSYMRSEIFGQAQNRLTQVLRSNANDLGPLLNNPTSESYSQRIEKLRQLDKHLADLLLAIAFVLQRDCPRAEQVIVKSLDFKTLSQGKQVLEKLSRKGFDAAKRGDPEATVAFEVASSPLSVIRERLKSLLQRFADDDFWQGIFEADQEVFIEQFKRLYG